MRVAVVSPHPVEPAVSGDKLRTAQLVASLPSQGVEPSLVVLDWEIGRSITSSRNLVRVGGRPGSPLARISWRAGLALARRASPYAIFERDGVRARLTTALDSLAPDVEDFQHSFMWQPSSRPTVCTFHNIESDVGKEDRRGGERHRLALTAQERAAAEGCDVAVVFSAEDRNRLRLIAPRSRVRQVPLGFQPEVDGPHEVRPDIATVGFVGSFGYAPNVEAARALIELAPRLREVGVSRVKIVGSKASAHFASAAGVEIHSDVPSVPEALKDVDVLVVPLTHGGGVRVKLIEALAMGLPIVTTAVGAEGLELRDGVHAIVVDSVDELADGVARARPHAVRAALVEEGRRLWSRRYSPERMAQSMAEVYREARAVAADRSRGGPQ